MNIIEAVKSGKPFKRKHETCWRYQNEANAFCNADVLCDDWEIKANKAEITRLIDNCGDRCKHLSRADNGFFCYYDESIPKLIHNDWPKAIPDWCPLLEVEE